MVQNFNPRVTCIVNYQPNNWERMYTDNVLFEGLNCVQNVIVSVRVWLVSFIAMNLLKQSYLLKTLELHTSKWINEVTCSWFLQH